MGSEREAVAWTGVDLHYLAAQLIVLLEDQPGEVGRVFQLRDDDPQQLYAEPVQQVAD